jgi:hypothetical protein
LCCAYLTLPVCTQRIFQPKSKKKEKKEKKKSMQRKKTIGGHGMGTYHQ